MSWDGCSTHKKRTASVGIYRQEYMGRGYMVMCLISYPYSDSSAPYLGTAILTILCFRHLLDKN